jgi:hypothetical protein
LVVINFRLQTLGVSIAIFAHPTAYPRYQSIAATGAAVHPFAGGPHRCILMIINLPGRCSALFAIQASEIGFLDVYSG